MVCLDVLVCCSSRNSLYLYGNSFFETPSLSDDVEDVDLPYIQELFQLEI